MDNLSDIPFAEGKKLKEIKSSRQFNFAICFVISNPKAPTNVEFQSQLKTFTLNSAKPISRCCMHFENL
jgi:hypothetical protein